MLGSMLVLLLVSVASQAADWRYSMRPGDTVWTICKEYTAYPGCWQELPAYNAVSDPTRMSTGFVLKIPNQWLKQSQVAAQVIYVSGAASYLKARQAPQVLVLGQQLRMGDGVSVNSGSATLQFTDGATIVMSANSELTIDSVSAQKQSRSQAIDISLPRGDIKVTVPKRSAKPKFRVKTPAAVAAVRGTEFRVSSSVPDAIDQSAEMRSEVLEGVVDISAQGQSSLVNAGFGVKTTKGQPPSNLAPLLSAPSWNLECTDPGYVEWRGSPDTANYQLVLMEDDVNVDRIISTVVINESNYTFKDLEEQCYQVKISSVDQLGFNGLESQRQLCYELILPPPVFSETVLKRSQFFASWSKVAFADSYLIEVSDSEDFIRLLHREVISDASVSLAMDSSEQAVYVRGRAMAKGGAQSEYSEAVYVEQKSNRHIIIGILAAALAFIAL